MKITIFSSNQPRHLNLVRELSGISSQVFFVSEVNTVFPGQVDDFFKKSKIMQKYFKNVIEAEKKIFSQIAFLPNNVKLLPIKLGDLNKLNALQLLAALSSDIYIVFGASFIKGWLVDFLIKNKAINIHMGLSPYYRGSSCNFWALYDKNPNYVGATIHYLSKGLDSGQILFHCIPKKVLHEGSFEFTMRSVLVAQQGLVNSIKNKKIFSIKPVSQDKSKEVRYTINKNFNDDVAEEFLNRDLDLEFKKISYPELVNPIFG